MGVSTADQDHVLVHGRWRGAHHLASRNRTRFSFYEVITVAILTTLYD